MQANTAIAGTADALSAAAALQYAPARQKYTDEQVRQVEAALIDALTNRRIAGAAVDVFDTEPLRADHPYRSLDNLLATPHIGYVSRGLYRRFYGDTVTNILAWLDA